MALQRLLCVSCIAVFGIMAGCLVAHAEGTQALTGSASQYDKSGIVKIRNIGGGKIRVWYKYNLTGATLENLIMGDHDYKSYDYSLSLLEIDCDAKKMRAASGSDYSTSGKVIYSFDKPREFARLAPETEAAELAKAACSQVSQSGSRPPEMTSR